MRLTSRFLGLALVILAAFWFTAENSGRMVLIDLVLFRLRISVPLLVFGSILTGMGISLVAGWRAERRAARRLERQQASLLQDRAGVLDPSPLDPGLPEFETRDRDPAGWH